MPGLSRLLAPLLKCGIVVVLQLGKYLSGSRRRCRNVGVLYKALAGSEFFYLVLKFILFMVPWLFMGFQWRCCHVWVLSRPRILLTDQRCHIGPDLWRGSYGRPLLPSFLYRYPFLFLLKMTCGFVSNCVEVLVLPLVFPGKCCSTEVRNSDTSISVVTNDPHIVCQ